ncbi:hypothetical protein D3C77_628010 [compost metagenome]
MRGAKHHVFRRRYQGNGAHADRPLGQPRTGIDVSELIRVILDGIDLVDARLWSGHTGDPVQRHTQLLGIQSPNQFGFRLDRVSGLHDQHPICHRSDCTSLAGTVG